MAAMDKNTQTALKLVLVVALGAGVGYGMVPFYRIFCDFVGIPVPSVMVGKAGEPKQFDPALAGQREITVRFMANHSVDMPVSLRPLTRRIKVPLGQPVFTAYEASNPGGTQINGTAVHTIVAMGKQGTNIDNYIDLQQCFCFEEQLYPARDTVNLPLSFVVTPDLPPEIHTITFAYTLYPSEQVEQRSHKRF